MKPLYLISMNLTTASPLHIGDGAQRIETKKDKSGDTRDVEVQTVARDHPRGGQKLGWAYLPATATKGPVRARFSEMWGKAATDKDAADEAFGKQDSAGVFEFGDAFATSEPVVSTRSFTAIDRTTRTALDKHLYQMDVVNPEAEFTLEILCRGSAETVEKLLTVLQDLGRKAISIGAGEQDGWGLMSGEVPAVKVLDEEGLKAWISGGCSETLVEFLSGRCKPVRMNPAKPPAGNPDAGRAPKLTVPITLSFQGGFLVNDPSLEFIEGEPNYKPLRDTSKTPSPSLPSSSFQGALRGRAERILRTLYGREGACLTGASCRPLREKAHLATRPLFGGTRDNPRLCPACRVFGAAGWASCVPRADFKGEAVETRIQDFVAIDRFTQGSARAKKHGMKFAAERAESPVLKGTLRVDQARLKMAEAETWGRGLLALALRDLIHRDAAFGFGGSKGYGRATGEVHWDDLGTDLAAQVAALNSLTPGKETK